MYRLLIVDDNADSAQITSSLLDWSAYGITSLVTASSLPEAEAIALERKPQLALVNLQLGSAMGYALAARLRSAGLKTAICIVAEQNSPDLIRECMRSGAQDYLLRPLVPAEVENFLKRAIPRELICSPEDPGREADADPVLGISCAGLSKLTNTLIQIVRSDYRSPQSLASIAASVGYVQMNNFYIHFKNYFGVSPSALRNLAGSQEAAALGEHYEEPV